MIMQQLNTERQKCIIIFYTNAKRAQPLRDRFLLSYVRCMARIITHLKFTPYIYDIFNGQANKYWQTRIIIISYFGDSR